MQVANATEEADSFEYSTTAAVVLIFGLTCACSSLFVCCACPLVTVICDDLRMAKRCCWYRCATAIPSRSKWKGVVASFVVRFARFARRKWRREGEEVEVCTICLQQLAANDVTTITRCSHLFHHACLHAYVQHGGKCCPNCRRTL